MTRIKRIPLSSLEKSELNERLTDDDKDDEKFQDLKRSIEALGDVNDPPLVRPIEGGGYEVIKGSRRVAAAKEGEGVDDIRCEVDRIDDGEALLRTITDNIGAFKKDVSPRERALSLYQLWDEMGDTENPSASGLADLLGVSQQTISTWLEPLSDEWEDTLINPLSDTGQDTHREYPIRNLSPRKLRSIRKTTGGGEDGIELAQLTAEHDLTVQDLAQVRRYVEKGASIENAVGVVTGELSLTETEVQTEDEDDEAAELETDDEEDEQTDTEPNTSPETTTSPPTSTANLSQETSSPSPSDSGTATNVVSTPTQPHSPSIPDEADEESDTPTEDDDGIQRNEDGEIDDPDLPETVQGQTGDLVASKEDILKAQEINSMADTMEKVEAEREDEDGPVVEVPSYKLYGSEAEGALEALDQNLADDMENLSHFALTLLLKQGNYI